MKCFLFFTKDGNTFDPANVDTHNMQILGTGKGLDIAEAFSNFKLHQSYLLELSFKNIIALEYVGDMIFDLEL
ncbi:hypothetical protein JHD48_05625 [Sulfurimonas sp. SAG-AH-194-I05]|nr:hypothetical protein [Sulfurimonas sp. SAG-AH-194-I05]MDF1875204.1 hypothetical protein [Sulfurimonas sp. SAG-AH-194-I05]